MASIDSSANGTSEVNVELSAAQKLQQKHTAELEHKALVEDVMDEDELRHPKQPENITSVLEGPDDTPAPGWVPSMSAKAAGKRKEEQSAKENKPALDTQSEELFPGLGGGKAPAAAAPQWKVGTSANKPTNGTNGLATNGTSTPTSGTNTPTVSGSQTGAVPSRSRIPGQFEAQFNLATNEILTRSQLKKNLGDVLKDLNKRSKATVTTTQVPGGNLFKASGPKVAVEKILQDTIALIGVKKTITVPVPASVKAIIIGKAGANIKALQEKTGARIQIPKSDQNADEDDAMIDVTIEGNKLSVANAKREIEAIANERAPPMSTTLRSIPAEFYPFIAGNPDITDLESKGVRVQVPSYHTWTSQAPPSAPAKNQRPTFLPAYGDNHITLSGNRPSVEEARAVIDALAAELQEQLHIDAAPVENSRHRFIIGRQGLRPEQFFAETGCAIILPSDEEEDSITIIGPSERIQDARQRAVKLAGEMMNSRVDISRQHKGPDGGPRHGQNVTQYLRERRFIEQLEELHQSHIVTASNQNGGSQLWELYSRDYNNIPNVQAAINSAVLAHPPSRFATINVDPFYHKYLREGISPAVKQNFGVHVLTPPAESETPVLLVFEGDAGSEPSYQIPRGQPSPVEVQAFKQGLADAEKHILDIIRAQASIKSTQIDVPRIFHDKLKRFIKSEVQARGPNEIPVRVTNDGTVVTLRGPAPAVDKLAANVEGFVAQAIEDERERDFTTSFDFPQKHANMLIGKGGSHINELREKFDVDIKVDDGKVELKGPQAKAAAAKAHISALGRQWADETTYTLKIAAEFHRELIGAQGKNIKSLETRHKVQIHFPRSAREDRSNADTASEAGGRRGGRNQEPDEVVVKGPKKGADAARDEILELLQYNKDKGHVATISVQQSQIPSLIGQGGKGMDSLREETGARIDIPNNKDAKTDSARVEIQIKGTKAQVAAAKKLLEEKKTDFDQTVTQHLDIDKKYHSTLIGAGGSNLRELIHNAGGSDGRMVQFPRNGTDGPVKIEGKKEIVEKIAAAMKKIVEDRENQKVETVDVETGKHRLLVGQGGEIKKGIESKFKVNLDIPRKESGITAIKVAGQPEDVEKAKAHILGLVKGQDGETIMVPKNIHHIVADNNQFFRKLRFDHEVTVGHGGSRAPPKPKAPKANGAALPLITDDADTTSNAHSFNVVSHSSSEIEGEIPWVLVGQVDNVAKAKQAVLAAMEQAKTASTGYLTLSDPTTYRYVIGSGGRQVNSIREQSGCKITVPKDQKSDEAIEIFGSAAGVEKAKDLILKAVEDGRKNSTSNGNRSYD